MLKNISLGKGGTKKAKNTWNERIAGTADIRFGFSHAEELTIIHRL